MPHVRKVAAPAGYLLVLAWVNAYVCRDLFRIEYTGYTNSIQGLWIAIARYAGEHWFRPAWWPYHDAGMPFEHTYMPLVPAATAVWACVRHVSAARAFNAVTGMVYILGPLALFVMAWQLTRLPGYSFWAALAYSLTSPARALIRDPYFDPAFFWTSRRLYTQVVWDDVPHGAALCFLPLAVVFLWRSLEKPTASHYLAAWLFAVLTAASSVFGAVALALSALCLLAVFPSADLRRHAITVGAIGIAAWCAIAPFLPPSLIAAIRLNQQQYAEDRWSMGSAYALAGVAAGWLLLRWLLQRSAAGRAQRFFVLFAWPACAMPLLDAYANLHFLPQAGRYQPEMEIALALVPVFALRPLGGANAVGDQAAGGTAPARARGTPDGLPPPLRR